MLATLSVGLMVADHKQHYLDVVRSTLSIFLYPLEYAVDLPFSAGSWVGENMSSRETLLENNALLKTKNEFLQAQMQKYVSLELENLRLRELLEASKRVPDRVLAAELFALDFDPFSHKVLINKGQRHEVYLGQPVIDAYGVFGQTVAITPLTTSVMLITDPNHALPVQFNRTGLRSIATGTGSLGSLDLQYIPNNADIREGDLVVTSGLGGIYPKGYPVAKITRFEQDPTQPYARVQAEPLAQLDRSREVLLVWTQSSIDEDVAP
ncbi:MAG: rod shape-determining protein MreC [Gammaproteobacteria bacterium]|nr:rod shape-determining protein MreC [Gammaproteobacteria bacterium]